MVQINQTGQNSNPVNPTWHTPYRSKTCHLLHMWSYHYAITEHLMDGGPTKVERKQQWLEYVVTFLWLVNIWGDEIIRGRKDNQKDRRMKGKEKSLTVDWVLIFTHLEAIWYIILNTCFQFLKNIIRIFTHFFPHTYFQKNRKLSFKHTPQRGPYYFTSHIYEKFLVYIILTM